MSQTHSETGEIILNLENVFKAILRDLISVPSIYILLKKFSVIYINQ